MEEQQAESAREHAPTKFPLRPEQAAEKRRRDGLELSRKRVMDQLRAATHPNHRKLLESSLAEIEARLARVP